MPLFKSQLGMIWNLLGAVSGKPDIVSCRGVGVDVLRTLDKKSSCKVGLQYPFSVHESQVGKLLRKPSYSVTNRINMFALLKSLVFQLWTVWISSGCKVPSICAKLVKFLTQIRFSKRIDIRLLKNKFWRTNKIYLLVQKLGQQWSNVYSYIESTNQRQGFQKVKGYASTFFAI